MPLTRSSASQSPGPDGLEEHLGVASARKATLALELVAKRSVIVDLAVEHEHVASVGGGHWPRSHQEIDDREPSDAESDTARGIDPDATVVRPTVSKRSRHRLRPA